MNRDAVLPTFRLQTGAGLVQAEPWQNDPVTAESPALKVVTDLTRVKAAAVQPGTRLREAEQAMIYLGVRMLFVVTTMPAIEGLVTTTDLLATLRRFGRNHLLVVEAGQVRGVVSRSQIERQLGRAIDITPIATSFAEIERALV